MTTICTKDEGGKKWKYNVIGYCHYMWSGIILFEVTWLKIKNAVTYVDFIDEYIQKCKEYGIADDFNKIKDGAGRPTTKYNIVFMIYKIRM